MTPSTERVRRSRERRRAAGLARFEATISAAAADKLREIVYTRLGGMPIGEAVERAINLLEAETQQKPETPPEKRYRYRWR